MSNKIDKMPFGEFLDTITAQPILFWVCPICPGGRVEWNKGIATCLECKRTSNTISPDSEEVGVITTTATKWYRLPKLPEMGIPVFLAGVFKDEPCTAKAWLVQKGWRNQAGGELIDSETLRAYAWAYEKLPTPPPMPEAEPLAVRVIPASGSDDDKETWVDLSGYNAAGELVTERLKFEGVTPVETEAEFHPRPEPDYPDWAYEGGGKRDEE